MVVVARARAAGRDMPLRAAHPAGAQPGGATNSATSAWARSLTSPARDADPQTPNLLVNVVG
jgi:hypothetical protein